MLKVNAGEVDLMEVRTLVDVTEQFVIFAADLLERGDISQEEYDSMTLLKKEFLKDVKTRYL